MIRATAAAAAAVALVWPGGAAAGEFAVGVAPATPLARVAAQLRPYGSVSYRLASLHALVVEGEHVRGVRNIEGVRWVEWLGSRRRRLAFTPVDPLAAKQFYLQQDHAFDFWADLPLLPAVRVGIIDSGIDTTHPDLATRILAARSFVGGSVADQAGHGTFVAGEIAAAVNNSEGIAGIAFPAELLVGKVVRSDGSIDIEAEVQAIRWAVDNGARVLNMSLGGLRDPTNPSRDTFSPIEAAAVQYAVAHGVVVVAAVGNGDQAPSSPWPYASWPSALPHVIGVSALAKDGSVPAFSDRDQIYNDIAAPGEDILSTFPRALTRAVDPTCIDQGYSDCGPDEYKHAEGTSFAAPQVAAAAALLLAQDPHLTADQVAAVLERTADDVNASNGCPTCPLLRDNLTGWGRLDIAKAIGVLVKGIPPTADRFEPNDDAGTQAKKLVGLQGAIDATLDFWDDQIDVYALRVNAGQRLTVVLNGPARTSVGLLLWDPKTVTVSVGATQKLRVAQSVKAGSRQRLSFKVPVGKGGIYYVEVKIGEPGSGEYSLAFVKT